MIETVCLIAVTVLLGMIALAYAIATLLLAHDDD